MVLILNIDKFRNYEKGKSSACKKELLEDFKKLDGNEIKRTKLLLDLKDCMGSHYKDYLVIVSYVLKTLGEIRFYTDFMENEFNEEGELELRAIYFFAEALLLSGKEKELIILIDRYFYKLNDEWTKLNLVEVLCDAHMWQSAEGYFPFLTGKGLAAKNKYCKLKNRIMHSLRYDSKPNIKCFYINLDRDKERKQRLECHLSENINDFNKVPGVLAKELPSFAIDKVVKNKKFVREVGAIGCFLGHIRTLETIVNESCDYALVLEDDAWFYYKPSESSMKEILKNDFDILYVNTKMMGNSHKSEVDFEAAPISERLKYFPENVNGWGGYGYIVTLNGAKKLLHNIFEDGILGHFDGQMGAYGFIDCNEENTTNAIKVANLFVSMFSKNSLQLNVKCLNFPLIAFKNIGESSRVKYN